MEDNPRKPISESRGDQGRGGAKRGNQCNFTKLKRRPGQPRKKSAVVWASSAGQGKTAGRGQKGQKSRSGGVGKLGFEGGQFKMVRKLPFMRGVGFFNPFKINYHADQCEHA